MILKLRWFKFVIKNLHSSCATVSSLSWPWQILTLTPFGTQINLRTILGFRVVWPLLDTRWMHTTLLTERTKRIPVWQCMNLYFHSVIKFNDQFVIKINSFQENVFRGLLSPLSSICSVWRDGQRKENNVECRALFQTGWRETGRQIDETGSNWIIFWVTSLSLRRALLFCLSSTHVPGHISWTVNSGSDENLDATRGVRLVCNA